MFKFKAKIFVFVSLLFIFNQAMANHGDSLYDIDILVVDESKSVRLSAFKQGLAEVFVRISGDSIVMDKLKRPAPMTYVKRFSYDPVGKPTKNARGQVLLYRMKIQYNGHAMENYLRDNGFPVWGQHRPDVVIWLAVRDGKHEYVLKDSDQSLLKTAVEDALTRRGVPQKWPLFDNKDKKILKVADIRGGFKDPVIAASKRYSRGPALTGSIIWNGKQWQSSWSLLMASSNRHWSLVDANYNHLISKAIDQAADAMGIVFAIHGLVNKQQLAAIRLNVQAVDSIKKYRQVERYLSDLNAVETAVPVSVDGHNAVFEVLLRSDEKDFHNIIKNEAKLAEIKAPKVSDQAVPVKSPVTGNQLELMLEESHNASTEMAAQSQVSENQIPVYYYKFIK